MRIIFSATSLWSVARMIVLVFALSFSAIAAEVMPPQPKNHFNDYAHVVSGQVAQQLDQRLADFERETSDQVVVVVFPKMQTESSIDDYSYRIFHSWKVGLKDKNNGVVLFVFIQDRQMRIQTGYGLEGALPDALAKRIIEDNIKPHFKAGDYNKGLIAGVDAILQAIKGEYKGTGHTVHDSQSDSGGSGSGIIFLIIFIVIFLSFFLRAIRGRGTSFGRRRRSYSPFFFDTGGWGGGGGGWSGGGGSSDGGGFSSGGGDSGGGGASGSW